MRNTIRKLHGLMSSQFGMNPRRLFLSLRGIPRFLNDGRIFRRNYRGEMQFTPCLHDRYEEGGTTKSEYFWQDLFVAQLIFDAKPVKHVDVGSRVDGFVAHVASFREIEVFDVRPVTTSVPGATFRQADMMSPCSLPIAKGGYCDSLSCLHALEHFGLGRYGDPINPKGYRQGLDNMAKLLQPEGVFYLSAPVGRERVEFNANWVFDPRNLISSAESAGLALKKMFVISPDSEPHEADIREETMAKLAGHRYQLALFVFRKAGF